MSLEALLTRFQCCEDGTASRGCSQRFSDDADTAPRWQDQVRTRPGALACARAQKHQPSSAGRSPRELHGRPSQHLRRHPGPRLQAYRFSWCRGIPKDDTKGEEEGLGTPILRSILECPALVISWPGTTENQVVRTMWMSSTGSTLRGVTERQIGAIAFLVEQKVDGRYGMAFGSPCSFSQPGEDGQTYVFGP